MRNLRRRRGLGFGGGGGGGGGGGAVVSEVDGGLGGAGMLSRSALGGIDVGGAVCIFPPGGCGGTKGTFWGGTMASEDGVDGEGAVAELGGIAPGAGGVGPFAVWLCDPGNTTASESFILALGSSSGFFISAKVLYSCQLLKLSSFVEAYVDCFFADPLRSMSISNRSVGSSTASQQSRA